MPLPWGRSPHNPFNPNSVSLHGVTAKSKTYNRAPWNDLCP